MSDPIDRLPCSDVVCARGGHEGCRVLEEITVVKRKEPIGWVTPAGTVWAEGTEDEG